MAFRIFHNVQSMNALRNLNATQTRLGRSLERLSSGLRVNTGKDGPADLVISEKMRAQISGLSQAVENGEQAVSLVQVAEGSLSEAHALLTSIRELAVHAANEGANDSASLAADQDEIDNALATINRIALNTQFGKKVLLDGSQGVQGSASDAGVTFLSGTENTVAGTYAINITAQAEQATVSAATQTGALAADENLTIAGVSISLTTGMNINAVRDRINEFNTSTGVTATIDGTNNNLVLTTDAYGASHTVTAVSDTAAAGTSSGIGTTLLSDDGIDVAGTIGGQAATGRGTVLTGDAGTVVEGIAVSTTGTGALGTVTVTQDSLVFQVGANKGQTVKIAISSMEATNLGTGVTSNIFNNLSEIDVTTAAGAQDAIAIIDKAIDQVSSKRGELGAFQKNTLESYINTLRITEENLVAAESVVRDTDFAKELAEFTKNQILMQSGTAMMTQANVMPQAVLSLLQ